MKKRVSRIGDQEVSTREHEEARKKIERVRVESGEEKEEEEEECYDDYYYCCCCRVNQREEGRKEWLGVSRVSRSSRRKKEREERGKGDSEAQ